MKWMFWRRREPAQIVELLVRQADLTQRGLLLLQQYMREPLPTVADELHHVEEEADEVRRVLIEELNRNFITPFDREDVFALSRAIDDMVDYADTTVDEMVLLGVSPNAFLQRMCSLLVEAGAEVHRAVKLLQERPGVANEHAMRAKALENRVERVYREAVADLFANPRDVEHVVGMLKLREIYRHLSNAADRGDQAANAIADVVVKRT
jgi:predicted phosphate transport protein (TIGR00153 family)